MSEGRGLDIRKLIPLLAIVGVVFVIIGIVLFLAAPGPWSGYGIWVFVIGVASLVGMTAGLWERTS